MARKLKFFARHKIFVFEPDSMFKKVTANNDDIRRLRHHRKDQAEKGAKGKKSIERKYGKQVLQDFLETTTIPGLSRLKASETRYGKLIWLTIFILFVGMVIYQSVYIIAEYKRFGIIEKSFRKVKWNIEFPAVTVCINSPSRWRNFTSAYGAAFVKAVQTRMDAADNFDSLKLSSSEADDREVILIEQLSRLNESQREELGIPVDLFVIHCAWGEENCTNSPYHFNNLFYGNCFTFNPGFVREDILRTEKMEGKYNISSLNIVVRSEFEDTFPYLRRDEGAVVVVHTPGIAPILDSRHVIHLLPGSWIRIGISKTRFRRLQAPYSSKCVNSWKKTIQQRSLYYDKERPYVYSYEACAESCFQKRAAVLCNCFIPTIPLPVKPPKIMCRSRGCDTLENDDEEICGCQKPCREDTYDLKTELDDGWFHQQIWQDWLKQLVLAKGLTDDINIFHLSGFEVYVATTMYVTVAEEPKIMLADFMGSIGGNLGLWIGISIISIMEVLELIMKVIFYNVKSIFKKNNKVNPTPIRPE